MTKIQVRFGGQWRGVGPSSESHNSVCPGFCPDLSRVELPGFRRMGSSRAHDGEAPVKFTGKWEEWFPPQNHTT